MNTPEFPPSVNKVPGKSDAELEEETILRRLGQTMHGLTPGTEADADPAAAARGLYENFRVTEAAAREKRKAGKASFTSVAKQMKDIASGSARLLERLNSADRNVFDTWAGAAEEDNHRDATPTKKWLELKLLLQETAARATRATRTAEAVVKVCPEAGVATRGRPEDLVAIAMTVIAAEIYEGWTGKLALRSITRDSGKPVGEFHDFLREVFEILGIAASPDYSNDRLQKELAKLRKSSALRR